MAGLSASPAAPAPVSQTAPSLAPIPGWPIVGSGSLLGVDAAGGIYRQGSGPGLDTQIQRLDLRGTRRWAISYPRQQTIRRPVVAPDGRLFVHINAEPTGGSGPNAPSIDAFDADGRHLWRWPFPDLGDRIDFMRANPAGGVIVVNEFSGRIRSIAADGSLRWSFDPSGHTSFGGLGPDGTVYLVSLSPNVIQAIDGATGTVRWTRPAFGLGHPTIAPDGSLMLLDTRTPDQPVMRRLGPDGTLLWQASLPGRVWEVGVGPDGSVYGVSFATNRLVALTPEGTPRWSVPVPELANRQVVVSRNQVFLQGSNGLLGFDAGTGQLRTRLPLPHPRARATLIPVSRGRLMTSQLGLLGANPRDTRVPYRLVAETPAARLRLPSRGCVGSGQSLACRLAGEAGVRLRVSTPWAVTLAVQVRRAGGGPIVGRMSSARIPAGVSRVRFTTLTSASGPLVLPAGRYRVIARLVVPRNRVIAVRSAIVRILPSRGMVPPA